MPNWHNFFYFGSFAFLASVGAYYAYRIFKEWKKVKEVDLTISISELETDILYCHIQRGWKIITNGQHTQVFEWGGPTSYLIPNFRLAEEFTKIGIPLDGWEPFYPEQ